MQRLLVSACRQQQLTQRLVLRSAGNALFCPTPQAPFSAHTTCIPPSPAQHRFNFAGPVALPFPTSTATLFLAPPASEPAMVVELTSILRKRRTKMNKHKLQKRRKLDRRRHLR